MNTPAPKATPADFGDDAPPTAEELKEQKASVYVMEHLPDRAMSRSEMTKLIEAAEKNIPDETSVETPKKTTSPDPVHPSPMPLPIPSPSPMPSPKTVKPAPSPIPSPIPPVITDAKNEADDNGIDDDDKEYAESYTGPKTVVDHPRSTAEFQLNEVAAQLGSMTPKKSYLALQKSLIGSSLKSCNFFFAAALIEAQITDSEHYPAWLAASLDTKYFKPAGWKIITLDTLKQWFRDGKTFDVAIQRDAPKGKQHGHVAIPVGLNAAGNVMIAEASYLTESNRIAVYSDASLASKFRIFVRYKDAN